MAVVITEGVGTNIDTTAISGNHRQKIVVASNTDASGVAPVDATEGLKVYTGSSQVTLDASSSNISQETGGNLATIATQITSLNGKATAINTGAVSVASSALPTGASTAANQTTIIGHLDGVEGLLTTIDADTSTLAGVDYATQTTLSAINSKMVTGTDIGDVTINNSTGASAVNIQDGGNSITVDNASIDGPGKPVIDSYTHLAINLAAGSDQLLVSSAANKQIWVYGFGIVVNAAGTVSFQDEDNTAISGVMPFAANSGMAISPTGNFAMPIWKLATDKDLEIDIVTSEVDGWLDYALVSI